MKRVLLPLCLVLVAVLVLSVVGKQAATAEVPAFSSVSEAAFDLRRSGSEDATAFLVGNFTTEKGEKFCFSGKGEVKRISPDLSAVTGQCVLLQSDNGAAVLRLTFDGETKLYSFRIASPEGGFVLTDAAGTSVTYTPSP